MNILILGINRTRLQVFCLTACVLCFSCATADHERGSPAGTILFLDEALEESAAEIAGKLSPGTRIVIAAFDSEYENLSAHIMDSLAGMLMDRGLEVADRRNLAYAYRSLKFRISGNASREAVVSAGKFLGTRYIITGQLIKSEEQYYYHLSLINVETTMQEQAVRL
jgi:hypothetical protein